MSFFSIIPTYFIFKRLKFTSLNYHGRKVVKSLGISLAIFYVLFFLLIMGMSNQLNYAAAIALLLGLTGLADDIFGTPEHKGLKGHFKALSKGKITTGIIKAATGVIVGLVISWILGGPIIDIVIKTLTFALCVNFFNLLDLRPGRALKSYILLNVIFDIIFSFKFQLFSIIPFILSSILFILPATILLYYDLKELAFIGDAGSNILGGLVGFFIISGFSTAVIALTLIILILLHVIAEKYSFTDIIEKNSLLRWFDNLGRLR